MRIEVPERAFEALESCRRRHGSMALLSQQAVRDHFIVAGYESELDWLANNYEDRVLPGAVVGFRREGVPPIPETPRDTEELGDEYG